MSFAKISLTLGFLFLISNFSFAQDLLKPDAIERYNEGVKLQRGSNYEQAEGLYQKALLLDPTSARLQKLVANNRGVIYAKKGKLEKAEKYFKEALKIDPDFKMAKLNLGFIYQGRKSELESLKYWLYALDIDLATLKPKDFCVVEITEGQSN